MSELGQNVKPVSVIKSEEPKPRRSKMNLFVKNSDEFTVEVFVWEEEDQIRATHDKQQVPKEAEDVQTVGFTFRKPNYSDTTMFMRQAQVGTDANMTDVTGFQDVVLRTLLKDWTITEDGKKVPIRPATVSKLAPAIALAATAGCLEKIF